MKISALFLTLFLSACMTNRNSSVHPLNYDQVRLLTVGISSEADVIKILGNPTGRIQDTDHYTLNFDDASTGSQRLSINFLSSNHKILDFLWIPKAEEKESSLAEAKNSFKTAQFKEFAENENNPHSISADVIFYKDEMSGVTIRYDTGTKTVEAIAMFDVNHRLPAENTKKKKAPYSL